MIDLKFDEELKPYFKNVDDYNGLVTSQGEHYKLLCYVSTQYSGHVLYDLGSYKGYSAIAMSSNKKNKVVSYDIDYFLEVHRPPNVEFRIGNFFEEKDILKSPFIMFDVDPHDGLIEKEFVKWLTENNYVGTVMFDDIHLNDPMKEFWESIKQEKIDFTQYGHWSGTGVVNFK
jgi:hypothetical protein